MVVEARARPIYEALKFLRSVSSGRLHPRPGVHPKHQLSREEITAPGGILPRCHNISILSRLVTDMRREVDGA